MLKNGFCSQLLALFLSLLFIPSLALAIDSLPEVLLGKVVQQFERQSYVASAVYIRPSGMETVVIERAAEVERRLFSDDDSEHQIIRTSNDETYAFVTIKELSVHQGKTHFSPLQYLHNNLSTGLKSYNLFISEQYDYVAGRKAARLSVIATAPNRYSYIYWVDESSYVILRRDVLDENGELIERMVFTSFALKEPSQVEGFNGFTVTDYVYKDKMDSASVKFNWLPEGFALLSVEFVFDSNEALSYKRMILTDGFAYVELYVGFDKHEAKITRGQQLDALHIVKTNVGEHRVSIEGQMPYQVLEKIGANIQFNN